MLTINHQIIPGKLLIQRVSFRLDHVLWKGVFSLLLHGIPKVRVIAHQGWKLALGVVGRQLSLLWLFLEGHLEFLVFHRFVVEAHLVHVYFHIDHTCKHVKCVFGVLVDEWVTIWFCLDKGSCPISERPPVIREVVGIISWIGIQFLHILLIWILLFKCLASLSWTTLIKIENGGVVSFFFHGEVLLSLFNIVPIINSTSKNIFLRFCSHQSFLDLVDVYDELFLGFLVVVLRDSFGFAKIFL